MGPRQLDRGGDPRVLEAVGASSLEHALSWKRDVPPFWLFGGFGSLISQKNAFQNIT